MTAPLYAIGRFEGKDFFAKRAAVPEPARGD